MSFTGKPIYTQRGGEPPLNVPRDVSDIVGLISPYETRLLDCLGDPPHAARTQEHIWLEHHTNSNVTIQRSNHTHIFSTEVKASLHTDIGLHPSSLSDEVDYQIQEKLRDLLRLLENSVINGLFPMKGVIQQLTTNRFCCGCDGFPVGDGRDSNLINDDKLNTAIRLIQNRSQCVPNTIVVNGFQKRRITESHTFESDAGVFLVVCSRWVPPDTVILLNRHRIGVLPLIHQHFHYTPLTRIAKADGCCLHEEIGRLSGEYTLEVQNEESHGLITQLGTGGLG